jgi:hypothetical protein
MGILAADTRDEEHTMPELSLDITALRIIAVIAAMLIFFMPKLLNYAVGACLLAIGIYGPAVLSGLKSAPASPALERADVERTATLASTSQPVFVPNEPSSVQ